MAKDDTIYVGPNSAGRLKSLKMLLDDVRIVTVDLRPYLGNKSTTAASVTFTNESGPTLELDGAAIASGVATVEVTATAVGRAMLKAAVTLASQEVVTRKFYVVVTDPAAGADTAYQ